MRLDTRIASIGIASAIAATLLGGISAFAPPGDGAHRAGPSAGAGPSTRTVDTASSAIPTAQDPEVADAAIATEHLGKARAKAVAAALATSDCDGCSGTSTVLQVIHADAAGAAPSADNSAVAWSSCAGCSSSAVSVQVVVARDPDRLVANNRALALNAACDTCSTSAAAIQFVLAGGSKRELTAASRELIAQLQEQLADRFADAAAATPGGSDAAAARALADDAATRIERVIRADLGGAPVQRSVDVRVGG